MIKFNKNLVGAGLFLVLSLSLWLMIPYQIVLKNDRVINSQTFPRLIIGLMGVCSLYLFIRAIVDVLLKKEIDYAYIELKTEYKSWVMIGAVVFFWIILHWLPFMISAILFSAIVLVMFQCKKWTYYAITFSIIIAITLVFQQLLRVNLP